MSCINHLFPSSPVGSPWFSQELGLQPWPGPPVGHCSRSSASPWHGCRGSLGASNWATSTTRRRAWWRATDGWGDDGVSVVKTWWIYGDGYRSGYWHWNQKKPNIYIYKWVWYGFKHGERGWGLAGSISLLYVCHVFFFYARGLDTVHVVPCRKTERNARWANAVSLEERGLKRLSSYPRNSRVSCLCPCLHHFKTKLTKW